MKSNAPALAREYIVPTTLERNDQTLRDIGLVCATLSKK